MVDIIGKVASARPPNVADGGSARVDRGQRGGSGGSGSVDGQASPSQNPDEPVNKTEIATNRQNDVTETIEAVREIRQTFESQSATRLSILFDREAGLFISRSLDADSGEVVRQFPPEDVVRRVATLAEQLSAERGVDDDNEVDIEI